jgi:hypothetical protein
MQNENVTKNSDSRKAYMREYNKQYRKLHPEYWLRWEKASPEKMKEYRANSYKRLKVIRNSESKAWRLKNLAYNSVRQARVRCQKTGMDFDLSREWAENRYTGYCELTNIPFDVSVRAGPYTISLDRIDNTKGYLKTNCRFILHALNMFKGVGTEEDMITIAKALVDEQEQRKSI